jgi:site-specific recombinase XerD
MLKEFGQVGRWLTVQELAPGHLDEQRIAAFVAARRAAGYRRVPGTRAMAPLLSYLREVGIAAEAPPVVTPLGVLLAQYRAWLVGERGLAPSTVLRYENTARRFLTEQAMVDGVFTPAGLTGNDVNVFLLRECARVSAGSAKGRVAELRSVLRFLYLQQITPLRLGTAVPPVGGWRLAALPPPTMSTTDVQRLLDSCDRATCVGVRDFAMMMLVARLGLRSVEVARLELRDLDWRAGELVVRGKARRQDRLPLPVEVGEALVAYLSSGRNPPGAAHLFLTCRAPRGPVRADLVGDVVERACRRAGLPPVGPHRLRHALAGELLRRGAGLVAISQVLRHRDLATTAGYAKVDLEALRQVAQPWPGALR